MKPYYQDSAVTIWHGDVPGLFNMAKSFVRIVINNLLSDSQIAAKRMAQEVLPLQGKRG
mgnify:CR=1 FL=1